MSSKNEIILPEELTEHIRKTVLSELSFFKSDVEKKRVKKLKKIVSTGQGARIDDVVVDPTTAKNILNYYNRLNDEFSRRFMLWPIRRMMFGANNKAMDKIQKRR